MEDTAGPIDRDGMRTGFIVNSIVDSIVDMRSAIAIICLTCTLGLAPAQAQVSAIPSGLQFNSLSEAESAALQRDPQDAPLALGQFSPIVDRPRLNVEVKPENTASPLISPSISWSLEAWEVNTASLAHIQCRRTTRTIESFLAEDCRFVNQPLPAASASLVQLGGRWTAMPGLQIGMGLFGGSRDTAAAAGSPGSSLSISTLRPAGLGPEQVEGVNFNVSFGMSMGAIGDLLLDLQLERQRIGTDQAWTSEFSPGFALLEGGREPTNISRSYSNAGLLGVQWRGNQFGAGLTGQHMELPQWLGEDLQGEGFRSFDIEFSWRAPTRASISVGVSNVLDRLPGAATYSADQNVEETVDGIYGRIPYVRYKHDL